MIRQINDVLFDLGNVLVRFDWDIALRRLTPYLSPKLARLLRSDKQGFNKLFHEPSVALESGRISFDEFHEIMCDRLAIEMEKAEFCRIWCDIFQLDDGMAILGKNYPRDMEHGSFQTPAKLIING